MPKERLGAEPWETALREAIKTQHRFGYSVRPMRGKVQVQRYWQDTGMRQNATLPIAWKRGCQREVLNALHGINAALGKGLSLKDAVRLTFDLQAGAKVQTNWQEVYSRFYDYKVPAKVKESTWVKEYQPRLLWLVDALTGADAPNNGENALAVMRAGRNGQGNEPGSRSRKLRIQYAAQMLRFAVSKCGASSRWLPPDDDTIRDLISEAAPNTDKPRQSGQALALSDEQFLRLFDSISNARWKLAVGLLGVFGLRGVELLYARAHQNHLHISYGKRTAKGSTEARDIPILDPAGRPGLGPANDTEQRHYGAAAAWQRRQGCIRSNRHLPSPQRRLDGVQGRCQGDGRTSICLAFGIALQTDAPWQALRFLPRPQLLQWATACKCTCRRIRNNTADTCQRSIYRRQFF